MIPGIVSPEARMAHRLFQYLESRSVDFVVVGDVRDYGTSIGSDIDLVISLHDLVHVPFLLRDFCAQYGGQLVQVIRHEAYSRCFDLVFRHADQRFFLHPDVCADFVRSSRYLMSASALLKQRRRSETGFWVPGPVQSFAYYFLKKVEKKTIDIRQFEFLVETWQQDKPSVEAWLHHTFGQGLAEECIDDLVQGDFRAFVSRSVRLHVELKLRRPIRFFDRRVEVGRWVDRVTRPTGVMVAFLGPDGVGKSSVIREVERRVAPAFRRTARFHLRPHFGRTRKDAEAVTQPHNVEARGVVASAAKVLVWWSDYILGYFANILPNLVRATLVTFDRYADDLTIDPKRYRYGGPAWLPRLLARVVPQPDLVFVLVADPEIIQARKAEVTPVETARQVDQYRELARRRRMILVDAEQPLEEVAAYIVEETFDWLEERTHRRLGLKLGWDRRLSR